MYWNVYFIICKDACRGDMCDMVTSGSSWCLSPRNMIYSFTYFGVNRVVDSNIALILMCRLFCHWLIYIYMYIKPSQKQLIYVLTAFFCGAYENSNNCSITFHGVCPSIHSFAPPPPQLYFVLSPLFNIWNLCMCVCVLMWKIQ